MAAANLDRETSMTTTHGTVAIDTNPRPVIHKRRRNLFAPSFDKLKLLAMGFQPKNVKNAFDNGGAQPAESVPRGRDSAKQVERQKRILSTPRLGTLKERKKLLARKCREAGVSSPMALAAK